MVALPVSKLLWSLMINTREMDQKCQFPKFKHLLNIHPILNAIFFLNAHFLFWKMAKIWKMMFMLYFTSKFDAVYFVETKSSKSSSRYPLSVMVYELKWTAVKLMEEETLVHFLWLYHAATSITLYEIWI